MSDDKKNEIIKISNKGIMDTDNVLQIYTLIEGDSTISQPERYKLFNFLNKHFYDVLSKNLEDEKSVDLDREAKILFKLEGESSILAYYRLMLVTERGDYKLVSSCKTKEEYIESVTGKSVKTAYNYFNVIKEYGVSALRHFAAGYTKLIAVSTVLKKEMSDKKKNEIRKYFLKEIEKGSSFDSIRDKAKNLKKNISKIEDYPIKELVDLKANHIPEPQSYQDIIAGWDSYIPKSDNKFDDIIIVNEDEISDEMRQISKQAEEVKIDNSKDWEKIYKKLLNEIKPPTTEIGHNYARQIFINLYYFFNSINEAETILNKLRNK